MQHNYYVKPTFQYKEDNRNIIKTQQKYNYKITESTLDYNRITIQKLMFCFKYRKISRHFNV